MNYRHAYHAGNFADVVKHVVLALVIEYMKRKEAPFRVIDVHAGAGRYALTSAEAGKTGEWLGGIGRLLGPDARPLSPDVARHLQPYLEAVRRENAGATLDVYPGSPAIALQLMRAQEIQRQREGYLALEMLTAERFDFGVPDDFVRSVQAFRSEK